MPVDTAHIQPMPDRSRADKTGWASAGLLRRSSSAFVLRVAGNILAVLTALILARSLGLEHYGAYGFATATLQLILVLANFGTQSLVTREAGAASANHDGARLIGAMRFALALTLGLSLALVATISGAASLWPGAMDPLLWGAISLTVWALPFVCVMNVHGNALRGLGMTAWGLSGETVLRPAVLLALVGGAYLMLPAQISLHTALAANVIGAGTAAIALIAIWIWRRPNWTIHIRPDVALKVLGGVALSMVFLGLSRELAMRTDRVMLGIIDGPESAGLYTIAARLTAIIDQFTYAIHMALGPMIAAAYAGGQMKRMRHLIRRAGRWMFGFSLALSLPLIVFSHSILGLFGADFTQGAAAMSLLIAARLAAGLAGPATMLLTMTGHERIAGQTVAIAAAANVALNLLLIPLYGSEGAAAATLITAIGWHARLVQLSLRRVEINPSIFSLSPKSAQ